MFVVLGKFQLFIYDYSGFWFFFVDYMKAFAFLTGRKSCC